MIKHYALTARLLSSPLGQQLPSHLPMTTYARFVVRGLSRPLLAIAFVWEGFALIDFSIFALQNFCSGLIAGDVLRENMIVVSWWWRRCAVNDIKAKCFLNNCATGWRSGNHQAVPTNTGIIDEHFDAFGFIISGNRTVAHLAIGRVVYAVVNAKTADDADTKIYRDLIGYNTVLRF